MVRSLALVSVLLAHLGFIVTEPEDTRSAVRERGEFRHQDHVRTAWKKKAEPEYKRDCRGCHSYRSENETRDPQAVCQACHSKGSASILALEFDPSRTSPRFMEDLDALRAPDRPFRHWSHRDHDCKKCHEGTTGRPDDPGRAGDIKFRPGWHTCLECHDPRGSAAIDTDPASNKNKSFIDGLNGYLAKRVERPKARFRHDEHLAKGAETDQAACARCHGKILEAPQGKLGPNMVDVEACGSCHGKRDGTPITTELKPRDHACVLLGTFPHGPHLDADARSKDKSIREKGCLACHTAVTDENGLNYGLSEKARTYAACAECHGQLDVDPLPVRDAAGKSDHGQVKRCEMCHTFGSGPMKTFRPKTVVERRRPSRFVLVSNDHPFITLKDGKYEQGGGDCRKCHRADVEGGLPTRIGKKPFSHDSHLPANPTDADCATCHADVAGAATPGDLSLYSPKSCGDCHRGGEVRAVVDEGTPKRRSVPRFPHEVHLSEAARGRDAELAKGCVACHVAKQGGEPSVGTLPEALDCSNCHDHGERSEICAEKDRAYVASCSKCHGLNGPVPGKLTEDVRVVAQGLTGAQWHPQPTDKRCDACHLPGASVFERMTIVNVFAQLSYDRAEDYHVKFLSLRTIATKGCADCHWRKMMSSRPPEGSGLTPRELMELAKQSKDVLVGYPGRKR